MISIHARINKNNEIVIPFEEWQTIVSKLSGVDIQIQREITKDNNLDGLLGLGKEIWYGIDPVEYQKQERDSG